MEVNEKKKKVEDELKIGCIGAEWGRRKTTKGRESSDFSIRNGARARSRLHILLSGGHRPSPSFTKLFFFPHFFFFLQREKRTREKKKKQQEKKKAR